MRDPLFAPATPLQRMQIELREFESAQIAARGRSLPQQRRHPLRTRSARARISYESAHDDDDARTSNTAEVE